VGPRPNPKQLSFFSRRKKPPPLYALNNWDPLGKASVLSRGIVGDLQGRMVVASPLYKQHFDLTTGQCLEEPEISVKTYGVSLVDGFVRIDSETAA